jgi:hypothetical protein
MNTKILSFIGAGVFALAACAPAGPGLIARRQAPSARLEPGPQTPAAKGEVTVDRRRRDPAGNSQISLDVQHLPPPSALGDDLRTFVVWITPRGAEQAINVGQLDYDPARREGNLDIVTPYNEFTVAVTAESASTPIERGEVVVVSGEVDLNRHHP